jgi:sugar lactone lactonase YvrE
MEAFRDEASVWSLRLLCFVVLAAGLVVESSAAVTLHQPGYIAQPFGAAATGGDDLAVDSSGRVYVPTAGGIVRFTSNGANTPWSATGGFSITLTPDGGAFIVKRGQDRSIYRVAANGVAEAIPLSQYHEWTYIALAPSGILYANVWAGVGQGLYAINPSSGEVSTIVQGGPGEAGAGYYRDMIWSPDGHLYFTGDNLAGGSVFRLDGNVVSVVASLPRGGIGLTVDPQGLLYTATTNGTTVSELWRVNPLDGTVVLVGSGFGHPAAVAYDATTRTVYVRDQSAPYKITEIAECDITSAVSRKQHGHEPASTFAVGLPLAGYSSAGIESRSGGTEGSHQVVVAFAAPVKVSDVRIGSGMGSVSSFTISGDGTRCTVNLAGVTNRQRMKVILGGVTDGTYVNDFGIDVSFLAGDTNGDGTVNASDIAQTKSSAGLPASASTFRADVIPNGAINATDIGVVKSLSGATLP